MNDDNTGAGSMLHVIILAAGEGKRMRSNRPKVLQRVGGVAMLGHLLEAVAELAPESVHVVVGQGSEQVQHHFPKLQGRWVLQTTRLGTGHATLQAMPEIPADRQVLVLPGDMPLVRPQTLKALIEENADLSILSFMADDPTGYGRILRDAQDKVMAIREQSDASAQEAMVKEVNSGVLVARASLLRQWLEQIQPHNAQGEYYLTDCVALAVAQGASVSAVVAEDPTELMGANDRVGLAELEAVWQHRQRNGLMAEGVTLEDPSSVWIKGQVEVGCDVTIGPNVTLAGHVVLGDEVTIHTGCVIQDSHLAGGTELLPYSVLDGVKTNGRCSIGPFARLRAGTVLEQDVKIGNFVETKKAHLAQGAKAGHLSYLGDAQIGEAVNIGAGTITCNYDGANKHLTEIEAGAFIGSNTALVAPVKIGANAVIGAGSVISKDAPPDQLSLARAPQRHIEGWVKPSKKT